MKKILYLVLAVVFILSVEIGSIIGAKATWGEDISRVLTFNSIVLGVFIVMAIIVSLFHKRLKKIL